MERITILLAHEGNEINKVFLQREKKKVAGVEVPEEIIILDLLTQDSVYQTIFTQFVAQNQALFSAKTAYPTEVWDVIEVISVDPIDPTITRKAFCNIPTKPYPGAAIFEMPVIIRHYRNDLPIPAERKDVIVVLRATNEREIEVEGNMVKEYDYFSYLADQMPIRELMRLQLQAEDLKGRFNPAITPVGPAEEAA